MSKHGRFLILLLTAGFVSIPNARGDDKPVAPVAGCPAVVDNFFDDEVWAKVGQRSCLTCHRKGGDAEDTKFHFDGPTQG